MIWADPAIGARLDSDGIGQTHDIGVSILARAKVAPAYGMQGRSLVAEGSVGREAALIQYDQQDGVSGLGEHPRVHTLRNARWRLSIFDGVSEGELCDLDTDPDEFTNLWDDPSAEKAKSALLEQMVRLQIAVADRMPLPTGMA